MVNIIDKINWDSKNNNWTETYYDKKWLVVHLTVTREEEGGARLVAGWFSNPSFKASTQYVVDNREIIQCVPERAYAWSAGTTANKWGIHVEHVGFAGQTAAQWADPYSTAELNLSSALFRELAEKHGIPRRWLTPADLRAGKRGFCTHLDVTNAFPGETTHWDGKTFPKARFMRLVNNEAPEDELSAKDVDRIIAEIKKLRDPDDVPVTEAVRRKWGKDMENEEWRRSSALGKLLTIATSAQIHAYWANQRSTGNRGALEAIKAAQPIDVEDLAMLIVDGLADRGQQIDQATVEAGVRAVFAEIGESDT